MATKLDMKFANGVVEGAQALVAEVRRLEGLCEKYEQALAKVETCKDDEHAVLKMLGTIAHEALHGQTA